MTSERQTKSMQLNIDLGPSPYNNQYLLADRYLDHILTGDERWPAGLAEAEAFLGWLRARYEHEHDQLAAYSEHQLEQVWFRPIFEQLGHVWQEQARIPGLGSGIRTPDYIFFPHEAERQAVVNAQKTEEYAQHALAVGEVKAWNVHLSKKRREGGPTFDAQNPSYQIDYYLKATGLTWGILSNGRQWRLVHRKSSYRLDTYYEVDLIALLDRDSASAMRYFTMFFRQAAFQEDAQGRVFLNDVLAGSRAYAIALEEDLRENAYLALEQLMQGFYDYTPNRLEPDDLHTVYENSLYLLYRLLFVLYGESRGLLPVENLRYRELFSFLEFKQEIAEQIDRGTYIPKRTNKYYGQLSVLFHIINGDDAGLSSEINVARYNGGLFDPRQHSFLAEKSAGDQAFTRAVDLLCRRKSESGGMEFVDYRTLDVRHLGSIYEGLLEYQPRQASEAMVAVPISHRNGNGEQWISATQAPRGNQVMARRAPGDIYLETDKGERKATGSYYTPQYIVEYIVEQTLSPLVERVREQTQDEVVRHTNNQAFVNGILNLKVLDPAMGSGHFLVAATDYLARTLATDPYVQTEEALDKSDLNYWQRVVVERCIYGVDKNPLAVELAKLSLWLTTFADNKPLGFLDHHLTCGDSLVGAYVADLGAAPPPTLDRRRNNRIAEGQMNLFAYLLSQRLPVVMSKIMAIIDQESDSYESVHAKEAANRAVQRLKAPFEIVANLWTSAYFGNEYNPSDYQEALNLLHAPETLLMMASVQAAEAIAEERCFFHWELAFPEVFFDMQGQPLNDAERGFDAVIGNPPWGVKFDAKDKVYIQENYQTYKYKHESYILFSERGWRLTKEKGFHGYITPSSWLAIDQAQLLRQLLLKNSMIKAIVALPQGVFSEVALDTLIYIVKKELPKVETSTSILVFQKSRQLDSISQHSADKVSSITQSRFLENQNFAVDIFVTNTEVDILAKVEANSVKLSQLVEIAQGVIPYDKYQGHSEATIRNRVWHSNKKVDETYVRELAGRDVSRYTYTWNGNRWISYGDWLAAPRCKKYFWGTRLVFQSTRNPSLRQRLCGAFLDEAYVHDPGLTLVYSEDRKLLHYVLSISNSTLLNWWFLLRNTDSLHIYPSHLKQLPIRRIDFTTPEDKRAQWMAEARRYYESGEHNALLTLTAARLEANPEQSDVIYDLLAYLAEQMTDLNAIRQRLEAANDPFKYLDRSVSFVKFTAAFSDAIKYGQRISRDGREGTLITLGKVYHDIDGMRLIPDGDEWRLEIQLKRRDPDAGWREWQYEGDGHLVARTWVPAYRFPLPEKQAHYYHIALPVRDEFTNTTSFPGGYTRSTAKKLALARIPAFDPGVDLTPLRELRAELTNLNASISATDALIDRIVYQLYDLTAEEIEIVEHASHPAAQDQQEEGV